MRKSWRTRAKKTLVEWFYGMSKGIMTSDAGGGKEPQISIIFTNTKDSDRVHDLMIELAMLAREHIKAAE